MGCGGSKSKPDKKKEEVPQVGKDKGEDKAHAPPVNKQDSTMKTLGTSMSLIGSATESIPIIGGIVSNTLKILGSLFMNIDGFDQLPEQLNKGKNKLIQIQNLLQEAQEKQDISPSLTLIFFQELQEVAKEYHDFIDERLRKHQTNKKLVKLFEILSGTSNTAKMEELNTKIDKAIQQFQVSKIYDDVTDQFPEQIKKTYRGRAGYNSWVYCFRNQEYIPVNRFVENYSENQNLEPSIIKQIADYIDMDKNNEISFREFMGFVCKFIQFYDSKGSNIVMHKELLEMLKGSNQSSQPQVNNRVINYPNGSVYEGDIKDGKRHGRGVYSQGDYYKYEGDYQNDQKHGFGKESDNGNLYEGSWVENQKQGQGVWKFKLGGKYEGNFNRSMQHGLGKLTEADGTEYSGKWVDGYMVEGEIKFPDGTRYEGKLKNTKFREGEGTMYTKDNKIQFKGEFKDNLPQLKEGQKIYHVVWFDGAVHNNAYYGVQMFNDIESAKNYFNTVAVTKSHAKVILSDQLQERFGRDYYVRCCVGYVFKKNILKVNIVDPRYFVYDIQYQINLQFDSEQEARDQYAKTNKNDKCIIYDGQILQKQGINYEDAWLGQYAIHQMQKARAKLGIQETLYHLVWFDGNNIHEETNEYYGYHQSSNIIEITKMYDGLNIAESYAKVIFSNHIERQFGREYYVKACLGFAQRTLRLQYEGKVTEYFVYGAPESQQLKFANKDEAEAAYENMQAEDKCLIKEGKILLQKGQNYADPWIGQWIKANF